MDSSENQSNEVVPQDKQQVNQEAEPCGTDQHVQPTDVLDNDRDGEMHPLALDPVSEISHAPSMAVESKEPEKEVGSPCSNDMFYDSEELSSRPYVSPDSNIPANLLTLTHSFGYDCQRRANLQLLDESTLTFIAGNVLVLLDMKSDEQRYLRSCSGGGIGAIMCFVVLISVIVFHVKAHPTKRYLAVAEKGKQPDIIIYELPSLRPYRLLRGGTAQAYSSVDFNREGILLASVGSAPDYMLTLWEWREERVVLRCKAFSQDVYRVSFSPDNPGQLTSSGAGHIKFWRMSSTFTGLKLQGLLGRFGKTALTDIEGYVELPDGKVVSGCEWGNMLLWEGGLIKVEICRKGRRPCHSGIIRQFSLDEDELITIGIDGVIRRWDFDTIDAADSVDDSGLFEMEPLSELLISPGVSLSSMVKSPVPGSSLWFAQDSNGGIWKVDLSFSKTKSVALYSYHSRPIKDMDVSSTSHLMATTALDRTVRVFDFLAKKEVTYSRFKKGGTALTWVPNNVLPQGELLAVGFEDGVVRLLELHDPDSMRVHSHHDKVQLHLRQALKPHDSPVSAIAFQPNGELLATGSTDGSVFFFAVGDQYKPIGYICVPGPVCSLEWSPSSHVTLLILCQTGHVVEVQAPESENQTSKSTYKLQGLPTRCFCFQSIKSRIKRDEEVARREADKQRRREEREQRMKEAQEKGEQLEEEEEEEEEAVLPPLHIPDHPSPLLCGFYSEPGAFWLSMGGFDAGFLYHCRFSEEEKENLEQRHDEPFAFIPVENTEEDPICCFCFSSTKELLLCGMQTGQIRVYPLQPGDLHLTSMRSFWALSVHDNQYGLVSRMRCSYDDQYVLTTGYDGNIFSFSVLLKENLFGVLSQNTATVSSPQEILETETSAQDIEDPNAYSIEMAKQRAELDRMRTETERRKAERRRKLVQLQDRFKQLLRKNSMLLEHVRLQPEELELHPCFRDEMKRLTGQRVSEVRRELAWEEERCKVGLKKVQERFWDLVDSNMVTVVAFQSAHQVSTYRMPMPLQMFLHINQHVHKATKDQKHQEIKTNTDTDSAPPTMVMDPQLKPADLQLQVQQSGGTKGALQQTENLSKAAKKAERAKVKAQQRKTEWAEFLSTKPSEASENLKDILAIQLAMENVGDFKLKTAKDFTVPEHLRMNAEKKRAQLVALEEQINQRKTHMNMRVLALRDSKLQLLSWLHKCVQKLEGVQARLPPEYRAAIPTVPALLPEEMLEKKLQCSFRTLKRLQALQASRSQQGQGLGLLELLDQEGREVDDKVQDIISDHTIASPTDHTLTSHHDHTSMAPTDHSQFVLEGHGLTELDEMRYAEELRLLHLQNSLLTQMERAMHCFDAELKLLRHEKLEMDVHMKLADLQHVTLFQELQVLQEFEKRESNLQGNLDSRKEEEHLVKTELEECRQKLELKQRELIHLQEEEKSLTTTFLALLGDNKFAPFLTSVFKKNIKRLKTKEKRAEEEDQEENSDEESDEESDWDEDEQEEGSESGDPVDDSVCPANCDPELFESTLRMRERRLDLKEALADMKKTTELLKKEFDTLAKKEKIVKKKLQAAEGDLELLNREKQQIVNELDVVVPLRLHQIEFLSNGAVPSKLDQALVMTKGMLVGLRERIRELQVEKAQQRELCQQIQQNQVKFSQDQKTLETKIRDQEALCKKMMMQKFGRLVDIETLQTQTWNRGLEELKQQNTDRQTAYTQEVKLWEEKVAEAKHAVTEVTRRHTEHLCKMTSLLAERKGLEDKLNARQRNMDTQLHSQRPEHEGEMSRLTELAQAQAQEMKALQQEITAMSLKDTHVVPPIQQHHLPVPPAVPQLAKPRRMRPFPAHGRLLSTVSNMDVLE